jgi:2,5-furandicarboxylate decarboxylase 1
VIGYDMPVVSGIIRSSERAMMSMGCETYREIEEKLAAGHRKPDPAEVRRDGSPTREVVIRSATTSTSSSCRSRCPRSTTAGR